MPPAASRGCREGAHCRNAHALEGGAQGPEHTCAGGHGSEHACARLTEPMWKRAWIPGCACACGKEHACMGLWPPPQLCRTQSACSGIGWGRATGYRLRVRGKGVGTWPGRRMRRCRRVGGAFRAHVAGASCGRKCQGHSAKSGGAARPLLARLLLPPSLWLQAHGWAQPSPGEP